MANVAVLNTTVNVSGKTWAICENPQTITGLWTFNRGVSAPFAVAAGAAMVSNLDAETVGGAALSTLARLGVANAGHLIFTDATYDIGASGATRPRDLFLSRNAVIGGTLGVTGVATFTGVPVFSAGIPTLAQNLLFTDATYDIGASGATRPRDLFLSRNAGVGGALAVTGNATADSVLGVTRIAIESGGSPLVQLGADNAGGTVLLSECSSDAAAPSANRCVIYTRDTGGKTQLVARFNTGAVQVIATEP
jgi:hypothetical protein